MEVVLQVDHLTKVYRNGRGVRDIHFSLEKGDILGLLGPNGSGKTTTMKVICGLCHPGQGAVTIFGHSVYEEYEKAMEKVGCLIEMPSLYEYLSGEMNLKLMANLYPGTTGEQINRVMEIVRMTPYRKDKVARYSLGMKQRLGLAMALISSPELVILDEPANGLDIEGMVEIRELITSLAREQGVSFLISSHLAAEIEKTCNKVGVIYEGALLSFESMDAATAQGSLEDYFLRQVQQKRGNLAI